jgi:hypothetical protein
MQPREFDLDFRHRSSRIRAWGIGLLVLATLQWAWCLVLLLTPYEADRVSSSGTAECESRLLTDRGTANDGVFHGDTCANERDWPEAVLVLGLSVPVAVVGVALFVSGSVSIRMSAHAEALRYFERRSDTHPA